MKCSLAFAMFVSLLGLGSLGCGKSADDGPPCGKVVDHMLDIMKSTAGGHGGMNLGSRQPMLDQCEQRHMSKEVRACLLNSKDITGLANCSRMMAHPPRAAGLGGPGAMAPGAATPAGPAGPAGTAGAMGTPSPATGGVAVDPTAPAAPSTAVNPSVPPAPSTTVNPSAPPAAAGSGTHAP